MFMFLCLGFQYVTVLKRYDIRVEADTSAPDLAIQQVVAFTFILKTKLDALVSLAPYQVS